MMGMILFLVIFGLGFIAGCAFTSRMYRNTLKEMEHTAEYMMSVMPDLGIELDEEKLKIKQDNKHD